VGDGLVVPVPGVQQSTELPAPEYVHLSTTVDPAGMMSLAVSPRLFQMYEGDLQYRSVAVLVPLPVWIFTDLPALSV
jgi:hypothetical protein